MPKVEKMDLDSSLKETITYESQMLHYGLYTAAINVFFKRIFLGIGMMNLNWDIFPAEA